MDQKHQYMSSFDSNKSGMKFWWEYECTAIRTNLKSEDEDDATMDLARNRHAQPEQMHKMFISTSTYAIVTMCVSLAFALAFICVCLNIACCRIALGYPEGCINKNRFAFNFGILTF